MLRITYIQITHTVVMQNACTSYHYVSAEGSHVVHPCI